MLKQQLVTKREDFRQLKDEWDSLLGKSRSDTVFLTWEWQFNWWQSFGSSSQLNILLVRNEENVLVGIAPLYIKKIRKFVIFPYRELRFIGDGSGASSEYLDFIITSDDEESVMKHLLAVISEDRKSFDMAILSELTEFSLTKQRSPYVQSGLGKNLLIGEKIPSCPVVQIKGSWQEYNNSVSRPARKSLEYARRKIERNFKVTFVEFQQSSSFNEAFEAFKRFYASRRVRNNEKNMYLLDHYDTFHKNVTSDFLARGWLYFCSLLLNDQIAASLYAFKYRNKLFLYQLGRDDNYSKFSVGNVLLDHVLEQAHQKGFNELDFLRGDESYKARWANGARKKYYVFVPATLKGRIALRLFEFKLLALSLKKRILSISHKRFSYAHT